MGCRPRFLNKAMDRGIWAAEVTRINFSLPIILAIISASSAVSRESLSRHDILRLYPQEPGNLGHHFGLRHGIEDYSAG